MRGGRNKFGPMYKRDRALRQQAVRQRQQMLAQMQCQMQINMPGMPMDGMGGMPTPPDIKPDINMLGIMPPHSSASNIHGHMGPNMMSNPHMRHMLPMGSPGGQEEISLPPGGMGSASGQSSHQGPSYAPHPNMYPPPAIMPPMPSGNNGLHHNSNNVPNSVTNTSMPGTMPHSMMSEMSGLPHSQESHLPMGGSGEMLPMQPMMPTAPSPPVVPQIIRDLQENEPNPQEIQQKLSSISEMMLQQQQSIAAQMGQNGPGMMGSSDQTELPKGMIQLLCKLCDQALFLLVEWARGAYFFKELKVGSHFLVISILTTSNQPIKYSCVDWDTTWIVSAKYKGGFYWVYCFS